MRVLVTGGTGFVGREVVRKLASAGHDIRLLLRTASSRHKIPDLPQNAEFCEGDVAGNQGLQQAAAGVDSIVHLVGIISEAGRTTFERVHAHGTENLVNAARQTGVMRFIHMSALGTRPNAKSRYHQTKWLAEECVRISGLKYTIFRPSLIYGPEDHFVNLFASISRWSPLLPVMGPGTALMSPISVADVARAFVGSLETPESVGRTFDLCGPEALTMPQILGEILKVTGRRRYVGEFPLAIARIQAGLLELVFGRLLGRPPPLNRDQIIMLQENNIGDPMPAKELFGLSSTTFAEGIRAYLCQPGVCRR